MYQGLYDFANKHAIKQDLFAGNANWHKGSKAFAKPIKARETLDSKTHAMPPHDGAAKYPGLYHYAEANFVKRDLVLEVYEARPWQPLPTWVRKLTRVQEVFASLKKSPISPDQAPPLVY